MSIKKNILSALKNIKAKNIIISVVGSCILAFGLYNVHSISSVTEGGVLGLTLLIHHWLNISPAISGFIMNAACYLLGWKILGTEFIIYSLISSIGFSASYKIFELFPPVYPEIQNHPLAAAIIGALFVGVGVGLGVRVGAASGGDDALSMSISHATGWKIERIYLVSDLIVLAASLSYIPYQKILYSLVTVIISGQLIGIISREKASISIDDEPKI